MADVDALLARARKLGESGQLTEDDLAIVEDVAGGGNPGWDRWVSFVCDYLPEPVGLPAERVRPGLLADSGDIEVARERMASDPVSKRAWEALEGICREVMSPGSTRHIDYEKKDQKQIWGRRQGHWLMAMAVEHLGWAYRLSGDRAYGEYARGILLAIAETRHGWGPMACNYGTPYKGWLTDNSLDLGHATLPFAVGFDLIHDLLSEGDREAVADYYEPYFHRLLGLRGWPDGAVSCRRVPRRTARHPHRSGAVRACLRELWAGWCDQGRWSVCGGIGVFLSQYALYGDFQRRAASRLRREPF